MMKYSKHVYQISVGVRQKIHMFIIYELVKTFKNVPPTHINLIEMRIIFVPIDQKKHDMSFLGHKYTAFENKIQTFDILNYLSELLQ